MAREVGRGLFWSREAGLGGRGNAWKGAARSGSAWRVSHGRVWRSRSGAAGPDWIRRVGARPVSAVKVRRVAASETRRGRDWRSRRVPAGRGAAGFGGQGYLGAGVSWCGHLVEVCQVKAVMVRLAASGRGAFGMPWNGGRGLSRSRLVGRPDPGGARRSSSGGVASERPSVAGRSRIGIARFGVDRFGLTSAWRSRTGEGGA